MPPSYHNHRSALFTIDLGPLWVALEPGFSLMERGMLLGIKERAERGGGVL